MGVVILLLVLWIVVSSFHKGEERSRRRKAKGVQNHSIKQLEQNVKKSVKDHESLQKWETIYPEDFSCLAMTREALDNIDGKYQRVGCANCNAYNGDTPVANSLPILCLKKTGVTVPSNVPVSSPYNKRASGEIQITPPVQGKKIISSEIANEICREYHGKDYRMAHFHDGRGRNFWAKGRVEKGERFRVAIHDQKANPWDCL